MSILIKNQDMPKEGEKYLLEIRHNGTVYDAIGQRVAAQAVQFESPWHRVEEELPDKYTQCLVADADGKCAVGYYRYDCEAWDSPAFGWIEAEDRMYIDDIPMGIGKVVAWMPIEPPKEDA